MGEWEDRSDFDKSQSMMERQLGPSQTGLRLSSLTKRAPRMENNNKVMDHQRSVKHTGTEAWPLWSDPTKELLELKLLKT